MMKNKKLVYGTAIGIAICLLIATAFVFEILPLSSPTDKSKIDYSISLENSEEKTISVTCKFIPSTSEDSVQFYIEKQHDRFFWYPDYIQDFSVSNLEGGKLRFNKTEHDNRVVWTIFNTTQPIAINYTAKLTHLDDAIARYGPYEHGIGIGALPFMKEDYGFITGRSVFVIPDVDEEKEPLDITVNFDLPSDWKVDTPWEKIGENKNSFKIENTENLIKPYIPFGKYRSYDYKVKNADLFLVILGDIWKFEDQEFLSMYKNLATYEIYLFGNCPYDKVIMIVQAYPGTADLQGYAWSGYSDCGSITLAIDEKTEPGNLAWDGIGCFIAHEFFHTWNGNAISFGESPGSEFNTAGWFTEGFTVYYEYLASVRSGVISKEDFYQGIARMYQNYLDNSQRANCSMSEAALRFSEGEDFFHLFYKGGGLVALMTDIKIRELTQNQHSLDDVMRLLYKQHTTSKSQTEEDLLKAFNEIAGADMSDFFHSYVYGTKELPFLDYLKIAGLEITEVETDNPYFGASFPPPAENQKAVVNKVLKNSPASKAGIIEGDVIISINGEEISILMDFYKTYPKHARVGEDLILVVLRDGQEKTVNVTCEAEIEKRITEIEGVNPLTKEIKEGIITGK